MSSSILKARDFCGLEDHGRDPRSKIGGLGGLEDVENREQEDPNDIDEMPVQPGAL